MAFSLESRAPLLDYRLLELSAAVPSALKLRGLDMKHILKQAVKDLLPTSVYRRTDKKGMPTPIAPWFRGPLRPWLEQELTSPAARSLFSARYVREALVEHELGPGRPELRTVENAQRVGLVAALHRRERRSSERGVAKVEGVLAGQP